MVDEIMYIEGMKNYIKIYTVNGMLITKNFMAAVEAMLPEEYFIRVHRSFMVSKSKIRSLSTDIIAINDVEIPIGKLFKQNVMKLL